jgi:phosphoglycolate phosphatase-like HAD superfamily hydrolase
VDQQGNTQPDLGEEFRSLGANLKKVLEEAWQSDERARLQREIETGLKDAAEALQSAATDFEQSHAGQRLKSEMRDIGDKIRTRELRDEARSELVEILRKLNEELRSVASRLSERRSPDDPQEKV